LLGGGALATAPFVATIAGLSPQNRLAPAGDFPKATPLKCEYSAQYQ
jgi:hypothetical protein